MVKSRRVGKERPFWRGFLLTAVTFGIYGFYWNYKAHHELYSQFDLEEEGRDEGLVWLVIGILFAPLLWIYQYGFVRNVNYVRERMGMPAGVTPRTFLTLVILATAVGFVFFIVANVSLADLETDAAGDPSAAPTAEELRAFVTFLAVLLVGAVAGVVLQAVAYAKLQRSVNEAWRGFERRLGELTAAPARPPGASGAASAPPGAPSRTSFWDAAPPPGPPRR